MNVLDVDEKADWLKQFTRSLAPRIFKMFAFKLASPYEFKCSTYTRKYSMQTTIHIMEVICIDTSYKLPCRIAD